MGGGAVGSDPAGVGRTRCVVCDMPRASQVAAQSVAVVHHRAMEERCGVQNLHEQDSPNSWRARVEAGLGRAECWARGPARLSEEQGKGKEGTNAGDGSCVFD